MQRRIIGLDLEHVRPTSYSPSARPHAAGGATSRRGVPKIRDDTSENLPIIEDAAAVDTTMVNDCGIARSARSARRTNVMVGLCS